MKMRAVHLIEDTRAIFSTTCTQSQSKFYNTKKEQFKDMIGDQGTGYWLQFCITLKAVLEKEGYGIQYSSYFQNFFIDLVERLTCGRPEAVQMYVSDVLNIARHDHLFRGLREDHSNNYDVDALSASLRHLFGNKSDTRYIKVWSTLRLYLRAVGSLLKIFQLWENSELTGKINWTIPERWASCNFIMPGKFEDYLKKKWNENLLALLEVEQESIMWWNQIYKNNDPGITFNKRTSKLGSAIRNILQNKALKRNKVLEQQYEHSKCKPSLLKGYEDLHDFFLFNFSCNVPEISCYCICEYSSASHREMFLSDMKELVHPYSQFMINFWSKSFGPQYWKSLKEPHICSDKMEVEFQFLISDIRMATYLNTRYYDLVDCETSDDLLICVLWNMPLCLNWLELLLLQLYEFEHVFLPFTHFPLRSYGTLPESLYKVCCKRARFLVKAAIIVAEYIYMNEENDPGRCYGARAALKFALFECEDTRKRLNSPLYLLLKSIAEIHADGNSSLKGYKLLAEVQKCIDLESIHTVPDIDKVFNADRRSISFWLERKEVRPSLYSSLHFYPEVLKALQQYKEHITHDCQMNKCEDLSQSKTYAYDRKIYLEIYKDTFEIKSAEISLEDEVNFIKDFIDLLDEDKLLQKETIRYFYSLLSSNDWNSCTDTEKETIQELAHLGRVYAVCATFIGDMYAGENTAIAGQVLLSRLLYAECRSMMADAASRFIMGIYQFNGSSLLLHTPPEKFIKKAMEAIATHSFEDIKIEDCKIQNGVVNDTSCPLLKVPHLEKQKCSTEKKKEIISAENLDEMCMTRHLMLNEISRYQFHKTRLASLEKVICKNVMFPYSDILEFRFLEEITSLKNIFRMEEKAEMKPACVNIGKLLSERLRWLQEECELWKDLPISPTCEEIKPKDEPNVDEAATIFVQISTLLIHLRSIFQIYLGIDTLTHPIFQSAIDILNNSQFIYLEINKVAKENSMKIPMVEYYGVLKDIELKYLDKLLEDCISCWKIPSLDMMRSKILNVSWLCKRHKKKLYSLIEKVSDTNVQKGYLNLLQMTMLFCKKILPIKSNIISSVGFLNKAVALCMEVEVELRRVLKDKSANPTYDMNISFDRIGQMFADQLDLLDSCGIVVEGMNDILKNSSKMNKKIRTIQAGHVHQKQKSKTDVKKHLEEVGDVKGFNRKEKKSDKQSDKSNIYDASVNDCEDLKHTSSSNTGNLENADVKKNLENIPDDVNSIKKKGKKEKFNKQSGRSLKNEPIYGKDVLENREESSTSEGKDCKEMKHTTSDNENKNNIEEENESDVKKVEDMNGMKRLKEKCNNQQRKVKKFNKQSGRSLKNSKPVSEKDISENTRSEVKDCKEMKHTTSSDNRIKNKLKNADVKKNLEENIPDDVNSIKKKGKKKKFNKQSGRSLKNEPISGKDVSENTEESTTSEGKDYEEMKHTSSDNNNKNNIDEENESDVKKVEDMNGMKRKVKKSHKQSGRSLKNSKPMSEKDVSENTAVSTTSEVKDCKKIKHTTSSDNRIKNKLKNCFCCGLIEPSRRTFKKCILCARDKWELKRFYCSPECQAKDWKDRHCQEHRDHMSQPAETQERKNNIVPYVILGVFLILMFCS